MEISRLLTQKESGTLEFKESLRMKDEICAAVSAFSNASGGTILIGVTDAGAVKGLDIGKKTTTDLAEYIKKNTDPNIFPEIKVHDIDSMKIISVMVKESHDKPVFFRGRAYKRVSDTSPKINSSEIRKLAKESGPKVYWDGQVCENATLADIDRKFVDDFFIPRYEYLSKRKITGTATELLEVLGCIKDSKPTNAGILLFGKNPQRFFMNAYIALARYKGDTESTERLDYREFDGNLFQQIDSCDTYIKEHIDIMSRLHPMNVEREDIPQYPLFSIRELIINAVCHRDYCEQGSKIIIKMFKSHIDYYNPGGLPEGITPKNILKMQKSRNPAIAKVLSRVKYIEDLGEGWNKIMKDFKTHPLRPELPKIDDWEYAFLVTIYRAVLDIFERYKDKLNERQIKSINYLQMHESVTSEEYAEMYGITGRQAREDLSKMVMLRLLIREGKARLIRYRLYPEVSGSIRKQAQ